MELGPILRATLRNKARSLLIVLMTALTLAIVVNCIQMIQGARKEVLRPSGFDDEHLVSLRIQPFDEAYREEKYLRGRQREDLRILRETPGVVAASGTHFRPWQGGGSSWSCRPQGSELGFQLTQIYPAGAYIQDTLGVELVAGRSITEEELEIALAVEQAKDEEDTRPGVAVISRDLADLLFPDGDAVGRFLETPDPDVQMRVVGVIDPFFNPYGWPIGEYVVFSAGMRGSYASGFSYLVRLEPGAMEDVGFLEASLLQGDPGRVVLTRTIPETKERYFAQKRALIQVLGLIIGLMVVLTSIGIFGMTYFSVAQRTRQIGTRRALGASRAAILRYFLLENGLVTSMGLTLGLFLAVGLNVLLVENAGVDKLEVGLVGAAVVACWAVSLLAALVPAIQGTRIPPAVATRTV